jgi:uncharacterized membrane protein
MITRIASTRQLKALSDVVFVVIITMLVVKFHPPHEASWRGLAEMWPTFVSYAMSYWFIAIVWVNHRHLLQFAQSPTPGLRLG